MNFDQYEEPNQEQAELVKAVGMLVAALYNEKGEAKDLADKKGREALIRTISDIPREIPARLSENDRELLKEHIAALNKKQKELIEQYEENRKLIKSWFWWIVGVVGIAFIAMAVCAFMLFK